MLRFVRIVGMTLVAMLAISGVASAHSFEAEVAGSVTRVSNATQIFKTGFTSVECKNDFVSNSKAVAGKQLTLTADVSYSSCEAALSTGATVSTAKYSFNADNTANLLNTVVIQGVSNCVITVKPQNTLKTVNYKTAGKDVIVEPNVSGIHSEGAAGPLNICAGTSTTGTYTGNTLVESAGQNIKWT
jgi:hypothetical protein